MDLYLPVVVLTALAGAFAVGSLLTSAVVGPRRANLAKTASYECGIEPAEGARGNTIPVRFYTVAMTFIIFDVEIMFLVPWAIHFDALGTIGYVAMMIFLLNLTIAFAYEWKRGGLDWD
ncbi:NADH-quinone oxidoreductase subunit A [Nocardioides sp. C4-1]|jgi:NADH-quinone oxidoreductase subunit A|uniref:NADH-quinone oxidoreductase subunit A n=1 Tax=Nocardioides sp. C4-1 TaxID=3151851 RepID=UPI0032675765